MSWSNVLDYFGVRQFHRIARACSVHGETIHFGYSMNWACDVRMAHPIDFNSAGTKSIRTKIIQEGQNIVGKLTEAMPGFARRIKHPPHENPLNMAAYMLAAGKSKEWLAYFFGIGKETGACNVGNTETCLWNPLTHSGNSTLHLTWTYDAEIQFFNGKKESDERKAPSKTFPWTTPPQKPQTHDFAYTYLE